MSKIQVSIGPRENGTGDSMVNGTSEARVNGVSMANGTGPPIMNGTSSPIVNGKGSTLVNGTGSPLVNGTLGASPVTTGAIGLKSTKGRNNSVLDLESLNPCIQKMEYAVRGPLVRRATEIEKEMQEGVKFPFESVIKANTGDCRAMGNPPMTYIRQVLAMATYPPLLNSPEFPEDAKAKARKFLSSCKGQDVGAYSDSAGLEVVRKHVAQFVTNRDGGVEADWNNVIMCAGASEGIRHVLELLTYPGEEGSRRPGVMIPIPQYPLYSATLAEFHMEEVGYYLDEARNWAMDIYELERAVDEAKDAVDVRAIVVINPGNPTGQVLTRENIQDIIEFAYRERLFIFADEVYQHNVYSDEFHSFKKIMMEMGPPYSGMELASFMSCSKGFMGECGIRGGYTEVVNMDPEVKMMLLKSISSRLCPTLIGQACMDVIVDPPQPGDPSHALWIEQKDTVLSSLARKATLVANSLDSIHGMSCNPVQGALYAFPQIHLPEKAIDAASLAGQAPDVFYAFSLLEETGICVVPGSGFGQKKDTHHFRITIVPQEEHIGDMLVRLNEFHLNFLEKYS